MDSANWPRRRSSISATRSRQDGTPVYCDKGAYGSWFWSSIRTFDPINPVTSVPQAHRSGTLDSRPRLHLNRNPNTCLSCNHSKSERLLGIRCSRMIAPGNTLSWPALGQFCISIHLTTWAIYMTTSFQEISSTASSKSAVLHLASPELQIIPAYRECRSHRDMQA